MRPSWKSRPFLRLRRSGEEEDDDVLSMLLGGLSFGKKTCVDQAMSKECWCGFYWFVHQAGLGFSSTRKNSSNG